jgi:hypothetical protein
MSNNNNNNGLNDRIATLKKQINDFISEKYTIEKGRLKKEENVDLNKLVYNIVTLYLIYQSGESICSDEHTIYIKKHIKLLDGAAIKDIVREILEKVSKEYGTTETYNAKSFKEGVEMCKVGGGKTRARKRLRKRGTRR